MIIDAVGYSTNGCTGSVFLGSDGRVYKLYRSVRSRQSGCVSDERVRETFQAELEAYRIASKDDELLNHTPKFYGTEIIEAVRGPELSPAVFRPGDFLLDCCLVMEKLNGRHNKFNNVRSDNPALDEVRDLFKSRGISYVEDADVFNWDDAPNAKFIDFATHHVEPT